MQQTTAILRFSRRCLVLIPRLLNARNDESLTPLGLAAKSGHMETVRFLLNQPGIDINPRDRRYASRMRRNQRTEPRLLQRHSSLLRRTTRPGAHFPSPQPAARRQHKPPKQDAVHALDLGCQPRSSQRCRATPRPQGHRDQRPRSHGHDGRSVGGVHGAKRKP